MTTATKHHIRTHRATAPTSLEASVLRAFGRILRQTEPGVRGATPKQPMLNEPLVRRSRGKPVGDKPVRAVEHEHEPLHIETVRIRPDGIDRQLRMEYARDPENPHAMIVRISLASEKDLPAPAAGPAERDMMSTQDAADVLNVSRPYVVRLIDSGKVRGVERTEANHRRIPRAEVTRIHSEMRATRQTALDAWVDVGPVEKPSSGKPATKSRWAKA